MIFYDRNAVAVEKDGIIVVYLPQKVSCVRVLLHEDWWNRSLHCDWKMVGKTARQAIEITLLSLKYLWASQGD